MTDRLEISVEDFPRCDVCQMPVEDFYIEADDKSARLVVECHRQVESITLTVELIAALNHDTVRLDLAFKQNREEI